MSNLVFIATSLDGYISDKHDGLDWLQSVPNPDNLDCGWAAFMDRIDAIVMGRKTFEHVKTEVLLSAMVQSHYSRKR